MCLLMYRWGFLLFNSKSIKIMSYYLYYFVIFSNTYINFRAVLSESDEFTYEQLFNMQRGLTSNGHQVQQSTDEEGNTGGQQIKK